jgi:hypothetical protein
MKLTHLLVFVLAIGALGLSACGAIAATPMIASETAGALPVAFIGIVDSIAGDQWVISGTTVTVDPDIVQDGPFAVGDQVKVEGIVNTDSSFTVTRVEDPTPQDVSTLSPFGNDNTNDANINDGNANINDANVNDDNSNANFNDNGTNTNDGNSNDDNSNDSNTNDDNGGGNTNDDNSNDGNTNDDNGSGNTNDDNSNDDNGGNSNDDNSNDDNGSNSNDDNGNDDNSGKGGGDDDKDENDNDD